MKNLILSALLLFCSAAPAQDWKPRSMTEGLCPAGLEFQFYDMRNTKDLCQSRLGNWWSQQRGLENYDLVVVSCLDNGFCLRKEAR